MRSDLYEAPASLQAEVAHRLIETEAWGGIYVFPAQPRIVRLALSGSW